MTNPLHIQYSDSLRKGTGKLNVAIDHASDAKTQSEQAVTTSDEAKSIAQTATDNADAAALVANTAAAGADAAAQNANTEASNLGGLKADVIEATERAEQLTYVGAYDGATTYLKNNIVSYNGSSYVAKVDSTGVLPTVTANWGLAAQRGLDGSGSMVSLNGKLPDENGNVTIDAAELGAETPQGAQAKVDAALVGAETPQGAQAKADAAELGAKSYTDSKIGDIDLSELATKNELQAHESRVASATELGHVKVGDNLTIELDGTLNAESGRVPYAETTGTSGAYKANFDPAITSYAKGLVVIVRPNISSNGTSTPTLSINGLPQARVYATGYRVAFMESSRDQLLVYDGTDFIALGNEKANKEQETWKTTSVLNGFTGAISFFKDNFGFVHVKGTLNKASMFGGETFAVMPEGYRPDSSYVNVIMGNMNSATTPQSVYNGSMIGDGKFNSNTASPSTVNMQLNFSYYAG